MEAYPGFHYYCEQLQKRLDRDMSKLKIRTLAQIRTREEMQALFQEM